MQSKIDELIALADSYASESETFDKPPRRKMLRAALEAALKPVDPVGRWVTSPHGNFPQLQWAEGYVAVVGTNLYAVAPPAQTPLTYAQNTDEPRHTLPDQMPIPVLPKPKKGSWMDDWLDFSRPKYNLEVNDE